MALARPCTGHTRAVRLRGLCPRVRLLYQEGQAWRVSLRSRREVLGSHCEHSRWLAGGPATLWTGANGNGGLGLRPCQAQEPQRSRWTPVAVIAPLLGTAPSGPRCAVTGHYQSVQGSLGSGGASRQHRSALAARPGRHQCKESYASIALLVATLIQEALVLVRLLLPPSVCVSMGAFCVNLAAFRKPTVTHAANS